jgi:DNA-directed RNA polymerase subunit RPC12/RpoP
MSEFKFACPVCGQHITADSHAAGTPLECPTCYRKIVVPQPPSSTDPKFILSAAEADKPRPPQAGGKPGREAVEPASEEPSIPLWAVVMLIVACVIGAALFGFRGRLFHRASLPVISVVTNVPAANVLEQRRGGIGLGAWNTAVEYTNVVVTKGTQTLYQSDFTSGAAGWRIHSGIWTATNGVFRQNAIAQDCRATTGSTNWSGYTIGLRARKTRGQEGFLIMFNVVGDRNWTWWNLGGRGNTRHSLENCVAGLTSDLGSSVSGHIENGRWYDLRVEISGPRIRCYLDNELINDETYPAPSAAPQNAPPSSTGP